MGLMSRSRESYWVNKGAYTDTHPWSKDPCRPFRAPYWRYTIILNSEINFYLLYNMCASVHADFCRPTGLEYARPGLAPTHYGTTKVVINYWCMEKLSTILSVEMYWMYSHCEGSSHWRYRIGTHTYPDYRPAWQAVFSVVYMSVTMVSQYEFSK